MNAALYNDRELERGRLTVAHLRLLNVKPGEHMVDAVYRFQKRAHLRTDGKAGPVTRLILGAPLHVPERVCVPVAPWEGRQAEISDGFGSKRSSRMGWHGGLDLMFRVEEGDEIPKGHKAYKSKWLCPTWARAAADGQVIFQGSARNGERLWIDHGNGWRTAYIHLAPLEVERGQVVTCGQRLAEFAPRRGPVEGMHPGFKGVWPPHLHFGLSPMGRMIWTDPTPWYERGLQWQL